MEAHFTLVWAESLRNTNFVTNNNLEVCTLPGVPVHRMQYCSFRSRS